MEQDTLIFALDIGTRSVIGVILEPLENGEFAIKDIKLVEHKERSMLDGQIHDVLAVSDTILKVKRQLEEAHGPLHYVSVAAAGRSLKTRRITLNISIEGQPLLRKDDIRAIELSAVQEAQKQLVNDSKAEDMTNYHCVGYSVVNYYLDDQIIGNLIDQRGKKASVEIIATFLPRVVVDSLIASLHRANLEMEALTLEPIAAIHVLIPPSMRKLNIAFVDIGAGTSDIAITAEGTIIAYGMVPVAGDEITEAISQLYLLDFHIAEEIKRKCSNEHDITLTDILGKSYTLPSNVIVQQIDDAIDNLANQISTKILELNRKAPQAVMLVGGGSQTPRLTEKVAAKLSLPPQRVAVRGADAIQHKVKWLQEINKGPELVTPIGIGISSRENPIHYLTFNVNGETVRLFEMKSITVGDAIIAAGIPIKTLLGRPGMAKSVTINGKVKMIPGEHGTLPNILLNDLSANIDTRIKNGDKIIVTTGKNGKDAQLTIKEVLKYSSVTPNHVTIEGATKELMPLVEINGVDAGYEVPIHDRDSIVFYNVKTIEEALILAGYSTIPYTERVLNIRFMGNNKSINHTPRKIYRNGKVATLKDLIQDKDTLTFDQEDKPYPVIKELLEGDIYPSRHIEVTFNGHPIKIEPKSFKVIMNKEKVSLDTPLEPDGTIEIDWGEINNLTFSDAFRFVDFDFTNPKGKRYVIQINGEEVDFNTPIKQGDKLELFWM